MLKKVCIRRLTGRAAHSRIATSRMLHLGENARMQARDWFKDWVFKEFTWKVDLAGADGFAREQRRLPFN